MADEFEGFANDPTDKKGKRVSPLDVDAFEDKSDEGKIRDESQKTKSSIVDFKTEDKATNGSPAAVVPAPAAGGKEADKS